MYKLIVGLLIAGAVLLTAPLGIQIAESINKNVQRETVVDNYYAKNNIPPSEDQMKILPVDPIRKKNKIMTIQESDIVVFRGPVTEKSVSKAMIELQTKSRKLGKNRSIYLILDTPGGSVIDGLDLIDFVDALPQNVDTITLFAASMGFQFVQAMDKRYVTRNGTLMSHRAFLRGLGGQLDGELESRYKMIKRKVDYLNIVASKRMGMKLQDYKDMIVNEYWVHGFDAVGDKAADEEVLLRCGRTLEGTTVQEFRTLFGPVLVTFAKCPLIRAPLKIDFSKILETLRKLNGEDEEKTQKQVRYLKHVLTLAFEDQERFVRDIIQTGKFGTVFPE